MAQQQPSIATIAVSVLREAGTPLSSDELLKRVSDRAGRPVRSTSMQQALKNAVLIQSVEKGRYVYVPTVLPGATLRQTLTKKDIQGQSVVLAPEVTAALWPTALTYGGRQGEEEPPRLALPDGTTVSLSWAQPGYLWGNPPVLPLVPWLKRWKAQPGDALLVQIVAEEEGPHRLTFHPQAGRDEGRVAERSAALAEAAYEVLQRTVNEVLLHELALRLLARGVYHDPCPPDSLGKVLLWQDDRFTSGFLGVRLADQWERLRRRVLREKGPLQSEPDEAERDLYSSRAAIDLPLFDLFGESESFAPWAEEPLSPEQEQELARQVYCFKASLEYRKGLWRRIEVRGDQSMMEFDQIMRDAFGHDPTDHLSEFYLAGVQDWRHRGLGTLGPWGYEGSGEDVILGAIGLEEGDELRYIYDFGDNIQHILQLEKILPAEEGVDYPRIVEQNKPRHRYCESCQARGQKTVATWLCIECSNEQGREVLVCEKCLEKKHEDHWADEMIY